MHTIDISLHERSYPVHVGAGLLDNPGLLASAVPGHHLLLVSDVVLPPGEQEKSPARYLELIDALATLGASRDACVLALGGGVVGDLAGFAAATWMRGVRFVQLPTTLLAMVDSSVGGKTAVDLPQGKNLLGAFHQPTAVIADTATLDTLPARELRAGLAEVAKYGALGDAAFLDWVDAHAEVLLARDTDALAEAITRSVRHKAAIVSRDERESGERALLNLGHSFGHAIEAEQGFGGLVHGEAVAVGMVLAARLSARLGLAGADDARRIAAVLERLELPTGLPTGLEPTRLLQRMRLDKKNVSGRLRLILWHGIGQAVVVPDVDEASVLEVLSPPA
jgi:3-dehydroquinate synthase